jgi:succinoglycan biosynthesis transport protein ExoP
MKDKSQEMSLSQLLAYWQILRRSKWLVVLATWALSLASIVVIAKLPDYYQAKTTILVDPQKIPERYVVPTVTQSPAERLNTLSQEVLSATRLQQIIDELQLYPDLRHSLSPEQLIDRMRQDLKVEVKEGSGQALSAFTITYTSRDRRVVAEVANRLAMTFIQRNLHSREQQANETTEFLAAQLEKAKKDLEEQESKLRAFRMSHPGEMPDQMQANMQALAGLQVALQANAEALNRLDEERILLTRVPDVAARAGDVPSPPSRRAQLEAEKQQLEHRLAELKERYSSDYPDVQNAMARLARVTQELERLPQPGTTTAVPEASAVAVRLQINNRETERLKKEQAHIKSQIAMYQAKVDAMPLREQQVADLVRNYETSKRLYDSLLEKASSAEMAADLEQKQQAEHFSILDPARTPAEPFKPKRLRLMVAAVVASFLGSIGLALAREQLDNTVRVERELREMAPAACSLLALIPRIDTPADRRRRVWVATLTVGIALLACLAVAGFLWKERPIL